MEELENLELGIDNINDLDSFGAWIEEALRVTKMLFGVDSLPHREVVNTKNLYIFSPLNSFNLQNALGDARRIIDVIRMEME